MNQWRKYRDEDWLREQYVEKRRSIRDIASGCVCSATTVRRWLEKHGIETRSEGKPAADTRLSDAEWLYEQYIEKDCSQKEIADMCGCGQKTVSRWLKRHDIQTGSSGRPAADERLTDAEWLREQYVEQKRDIPHIAELCGCSVGAVSRWLDKHQIETRPTKLWGEENPNYNGGPRSYGPGWTRKKRRQVRERDNYTCQDPHCSVTQEKHLEEHGAGLHVHHLRKARDVEDPKERNAAENLITLCRDCHRRWEKIADAGLVPQLD